MKLLRLKKRFLLYLRLVRPKQWVKNVLIFAAPFTGGVFFDLENFKKLLVGFLIFSFIASFGYVINDWIDKDSDSLNVFKMNRPFVDGQLSIRDLIAVSITLLSSSLILLFFASAHFLIYILIYFINTLLYSFRFKHIPVVEMVILSFGFLLRPLIGADILDLPVSEHFLIVVIFGSLFMVASKRLSELKNDLSQNARRVVLQYSDSFLESVITMSIAICLISYFLWALSVYPDSIWVKISLFPMLTGILRYSWMRDRDNGEAPEYLIFQDFVIPLCGFLVLVLLAIPIYG